ncbi:hypothetical protein [Ramlibacter sp. Leaf400]|uniref:hypothetical protein n=1 Tax=Ramlibacter sp. Leaf400 TaxID=1736365 RepID=UPI0006FBB4E7|nr:hypothetical protein [Ramlibacter sp. Leaf400]KQT10847.1 hypothetical protein ASG30_08535 [Ramlibacter sp. Leaf400]
MRPVHFTAAILSTLLGSAIAQVPPTPATRGAMLYENHCGACHSEQMHWRAQRRAQDWNSLRALVLQWQGEARLGWNGEDIDAVARHLNDTIYRFPAPQRVAGR